VKKYKTAKMAGHNTDIIKELEEILGSLRITEDKVSNRSTKPATPETDEMLTELASAVHNENVLTKTIVPDPGWFDENRMKFEDW